MTAGTLGNAIAGCTASSGATGPVPRVTQIRIRSTNSENSLPGEPHWRITHVGRPDAIEGFTGQVSVRQGDPVTLYVSTTAREFRVANPSFRDVAIEICHPGLPPRTDEPAGDAGDPAALIVGRMSASEAYKGHEQLLRIWPRVLAKHRAAALWIVGDGDDRPRLEALAARFGVSGAVTFTGRISDAELDERYRRCRFFVMPSRYEGFGLVFLEAMRAGKACIGAPGAAAEIIQHGVTGLIADPLRDDDVYGAIVHLFDDPVRCVALGRAGAARFDAEFTDTRFAARFGAHVPVGGPMPAPLNRAVS